MREAAVEHALDARGLAAAHTIASGLQQEAAAELKMQGLAGAALHTVSRIHIRYQGTDTALACEMPGQLPPLEALRMIREEFERSYRRRFEFVMPNHALVIEAVAVECVAPGAAAPPPHSQEPSLPYEPEADANISMYCLADEQAAGWREARLYRTEGLRDGARVAGPAILADRHATTVVEPGWEARVTVAGCIDLRRVRRRPGSSAVGTDADPVMLELFNNIFMNIAEQMGLRLQNTAYSVNIKERLDFSCALFDADGALIANAPHMPVHLGSMGDSVRAALSTRPKPGDVIALNNPYRGGTHLPDVTVVMPV